MMKNKETGRYQREGKWQIMIHGESYKPIVAEAAKKSADKIYNRIMITHLLMDENKDNRVGGAVGFNMRTGDYYVFRCKKYAPTGPYPSLNLHNTILFSIWVILAPAAIGRA